VIGGLLDVALHPQFARNRLVYFSYSKPDAQNEALRRRRSPASKWDGGSTLTEVKDISSRFWYSGEMAARNNRCCGQGRPADGSYGWIVFDRTAISSSRSATATGAKRRRTRLRTWANRARPRRRLQPRRTTVRRQGRPTSRTFWTIGHRNPLGLTIHPVTGELLGERVRAAAATR
jgi:glucose/arabinose dehydrogenase